MGMYQYIADNNTDAALAVCDKYGYDCKTTDDVAEALEQIVASHGEDGLREIAEVHPEREIFVHFLTVKPQGACGDGCKGDFYKNIQRAKIGYSATGVASVMQPSVVKNISSNTGILILAAAVLIGVAIIVKS